jgi:hypothetical protein
MAVMLVSIVGCVGTKQPSTTQTVSGDIPSPNVGAVPVGRYGLACRTYQEPHTVGSPSYLVSDIGKPGVPVLEPEDAATLRRVLRYKRSATLRFAYILGQPPYSDQRSFALFDPANDPCADHPVRVINSSNKFYSPGEAPGYIGAFPGEGLGTPAPWITPEPRMTNAPSE